MVANRSGYLNTASTKIYVSNQISLYIKSLKYYPEHKIFINVYLYIF